MLPEEGALLDSPDQHEQDTRYHHRPQVAAPGTREESNSAMVSVFVAGDCHDISLAVEVFCRPTYHVAFEKKLMG